MKNLDDWFRSVDPGELLRFVPYRTQQRQRAARMTMAGIYRQWPEVEWCLHIADRTDDGRFWTPEDFAELIRYMNERNRLYERMRMMGTFDPAHLDLHRGCYLVHTVRELKDAVYIVNIDAAATDTARAVGDYTTHYRPGSLEWACDYIRDVFPPPSKLGGLEPKQWQLPDAWKTTTVLALARQMWDGREFSAMPILADALQDAGCDREDVLAHCRNPDQPHCRGCWVIDGILPVPTV